MFHQLFNLTRPLFCLDCETTGVEKTARIIELGFEEWFSDGLVKDWVTRINPGIPIPAAVTAVHGITDADVADRPHFRQIAKSLAAGFSNCDFAGKNVRFDLRRIAYEMSLAGVIWSYVGARIIDADRLEQLGVPRDLASLHEKYTGQKHDGAHGALSDVRASTTVIIKQLETYAVLPRDLDALHTLQWPGWLVSDGSFRVVDGVATCMFGKHVNQSIKSIPQDYWSYILRNDFPEDVKILARDAKQGRYPGETLL